MLIIDDSRLARMMIRSAASQLRPELEITDAETGDQAVEMLDRLTDLVACTIDHNMPGIKGLELAAVIRARHPAARLALVTANIQDALRRRTEDAGLMFIDKPITRDKLADLILG